MPSDTQYPNATRHSLLMCIHTDIVLMVGGWPAYALVPDLCTVESVRHVHQHKVVTVSKIAYVTGKKVVYFF